MSLLNHRHHITVKPFALVPALLDLPAINREPASVSNASSRHLSESIRASIDLAEGCILTKTIKYTHQVVHFVNVVQSGDPIPVEDVINSDLRIIPYEGFTLNHPCNLALFEPFVHSALDLYAFIALAPSSSTLDRLIDMVKFDNERRQRIVDERGIGPYRSLNFDDPSFTDPEYELIALHPEHFLPNAVLSIYERTTGTCKNYVPSRDRRLRESIEPTSARLPAFRHVFQKRPSEYDNVNVFLVAINAEIKFRRYLKMIEHHQPETLLPPDVLSLMGRVLELVDLLYWQPYPTKGSQGSLLRAKHDTATRKNPERSGRSSLRYIETSSGEESGMEVEDHVTLPRARRTRKWLPDADPQTRKAYGSALMAGHDFDYDPALFEDAFPLDDIPRLYSDNVNIERWNQSIISDV